MHKFITKLSGSLFLLVLSGCGILLPAAPETQPPQSTATMTPTPATGEQVGTIPGPTVSGDESPIDTPYVEPTQPPLIFTARNSGPAS